MADSSAAPRSSIIHLIFVPAVISLGVTLLRLSGELLRWPKLLFNSAAGGGGALVGISWLPIIFGPYFAVKLLRANRGPASSGKALGYAALGAILYVGGSFMLFTSAGSSADRMLIGLLLIVVAGVLQFIPWRALAKTLIAYAYAARIPVAIVMYFAMRGHWHTHYDAPPPEAVPSTFWLKYLYLAVIPQFVMWIAYTIVLGALVATFYLAVFRRKRPSPGTP